MKQMTVLILFLAGTMAAGGSPMPADGSVPSLIPFSPVPARAPGGTDELSVLMIHADYRGIGTTLRDSLISPFGHTVTGFDAREATPSVSELMPYDAVITWTNNTYQDPSAMGNNLADYVDAGGAVIVATFAHTTGWALEGRIMTGTYATVVPGANERGNSNLGWHNAGHQIMDGVSTALRGYFRSVVTRAPGADSVANWDDGRPCVTVSANAKVVDINMNAGNSGDPYRQGPWCTMFNNALNFIAPAFDNDVGVSHLLTPVGMADSGSVVVPSCSVANYGLMPTSGFDVRMRIGTFYDETAPVPTLNPGEKEYVEFSTVVLDQPIGTYLVSCSTEYSADMNEANDRRDDSLRLVRNTGMEENPGVRMRIDELIPTAVRGNLSLPGESEARLLDASGRLRAVLRPGDNDIRHLEPGVCFVRQGNRTTKLVIRH
jgi:hypothetical protein